MDIKEIKELLKSDKYSFLRNNMYLGQNIILLALGGSYAYGTNNDDSDIDIRGIATNTKRNILTSNDFEQVVETETDTVIYSLDKIVKLLYSCNPNTIEILGLESWQYLYLSDAGKKLLDNKEIFLSKMAINSFGGYANAQLRRLENKAALIVSQSQQEQHILKSIEHASEDFKSKFFEMPDDAIKLYIDVSQNELYDTEIFFDANLHHYPLRDFKGMFNCMGEIIKSYSKIGKRNEKAIEHNKLGKHMMHLVRLYLMCFDILENGEIHTYRDKDHNLLMSIRNGEYLDSNRQPIPEFYELVNSLEKRLDYASKNTDLPDKPNIDKIKDLVESINESVVLGK